MKYGILIVSHVLEIAQGVSETSISSIYLRFNVELAGPKQHYIRKLKYTILVQYPGSCIL